jgi:Protein of unknown function (DUF2442)
VPLLRLTQTTEVAAQAVRFEDDTLIVVLDDGRELRLALERVPWLSWLRRATPEQRANWSLEPRGFAVFWPDLDDGIEVRHLLSLGRLA